MHLMNEIGQSVRHKLNVLNTYAHSRTRKIKTSAYYGHKSLLKCTHVYMYETAYVQLLQRVAACRLTTTTKIIAVCNRTIIAGQNKLYFFISICKFVDTNHNITKHVLLNRSKTEKGEICFICDTSGIILNVKDGLFYNVASSTA